MHKVKLPGPSDIFEAWWTESCKKIKNATVFLDDITAESLHWCGGLNRLLKCGAEEVKEFSSFENCDNVEKAVFLISSPIVGTTRNIIRDIVSSASLMYVVVITGAHNSIHNYYLNETEEDDTTFFCQLENNILLWMGNMNYTVEIFHYPLFAIPATEKLFLLPKFCEIFPILEDDYLYITKMNTQTSRADQRNIHSMSDVEFGSLPKILRKTIRHLVSFFHSLFQSMNAREEIFSIGNTARIVAKELDSYGPSKHRRKVSPNKVSLVLIDRNLDLVDCSSHCLSTLLGRIMSLLPRLPGHKIESAVNMSPLCHIHPECDWTLLPGSLVHPDDPGCKEVLNNVVHSNTNEALSFLNKKISDVASSCQVKLKNEGKMAEKILNNTLELYHSLKMPSSHFGLIQQGLAVSACFNDPKAEIFEEIYSIERGLLQSISEKEEGTVLEKLIQLLVHRKENKYEIEDILSLMIYCASLGGAEVMAVEKEYFFTNVLSQAILEDKDNFSHIMQEIVGRDVDEIFSLEVSSRIWQKLISVSTSRSNLKDYSILYGRDNPCEPFRYQNLVSRLVRDCLAGSSVQMNDLECKATGFRNMIKSGFSLFVNVSKPMPRDAASVIFYIIGGISPNEILQLTKMVEGIQPLCDVYIASSHIATSSDVTRDTFRLNPLFS